MELAYQMTNFFRSNSRELETVTSISDFIYDATNGFIGSPDISELKSAEKLTHSFQDIKISFVKPYSVAPAIEVPSTSSMIAEDDYSFFLDKPSSSSTTIESQPKKKSTSAPVEHVPQTADFGISTLLADPRKLYLKKDSCEELVWESLPADLPVFVDPLLEDKKNNNMPKIQKKIKKASVRVEAEINKTSRRNSENYAYYSNSGDRTLKKNRNLPGIFRDRFINKLYYIINKEKILATTQADLSRNYNRLAVKDPEIKFIYCELAGLSEKDFSDMMRFLYNYQQDLDEYKYFDMCRKYKGWHEIQTDSSLESPNFYNYMKKIFNGRITEEAWKNYIMYTPKQDILNNLEFTIRSSENSNDFMFKNWKENKTWKKLRDLCTLDGYGKAPFYFWRLMEQYLSQRNLTHEDEVDREIFSDLFLKEFKIEVSRYCQLKYYLKKNEFDY